MIKVYYNNKTVSIPKLQIKHVNIEISLLRKKIHLYPLKNETGAMIAAPVFIFVPDASINPLCGIWSVRNNAFVYRYAKYT